MLIGPTGIPKNICFPLSFGKKINIDCNLDPKKSCKTLKIKTEISKNWIIVYDKSAFGSTYNLVHWHRILSMVSMT